MIDTNMSWQHTLSQQKGNEDVTPKTAERICEEQGQSYRVRHGRCFASHRTTVLGPAPPTLCFAYWSAGGNRCGKRWDTAEGNASAEAHLPQSHVRILQAFLELKTVDGS